MALTIVSFIGKGSRSEQSQGYRTTRYLFPQPWEGAPDVSVFGVALLKYYEQRLGKPVDHWIVLGSPQSNWDALLEAVPENKWDDALNRIHEDVRVAVANEEKLPSSSGCGQLTQSVLNRWSEALSRRLEHTTIRCQLVGWCEDTDVQLEMWRVISQEVPEGSELILDITHGFRHQPILLAPMVILLSLLRNISRVELYYGALDMPGSKQDGSRVLKLDLFPELITYIRHVSLYQMSGDYEPLMRELISDDPNLCEELQSIAFLERTNRPVNSKRVGEFLSRASSKISQNHPLQGDLYTLMQKAMEKHQQPNHLLRMMARADAAMKHRDYLVAYTLLREVTERIEPANQEEEKILNAFRTVRNALVHASDKKAAKYLQSHETLYNLYKEARQVVENHLRSGGGSS